ncbi:MAG: HEAT repeat domain-containing protein, partial [Nitrospirae bacterium]|nr:HEAT repeat domain-containing protein [Nitrospirota bacterium]
MGYLWTLENLAGWAQSRHVDARLWAARHLEEYYPEEAAPIMASLLQDADEEVAAMAAEYFHGRPDPRFADSLLRVIETGKGFVLASCARALAEMGDDRFIPLFLKRYTSESLRLLDHLGVLAAMARLKRPEGMWLLRELMEKALRKLEKGNPVAEENR